jgi:2-hydroxy-6-oxonona-2,4-dienedioate hydrolase
MIASERILRFAQDDTVREGVVTMAVTELTEAATSKYAKVRDLNIHYNDTETAGSVVICLHGAGPGASSWSNFTRNVEALAGRHRVILADMPNYGKSDDFIGHDPNLNVWATVGLMDALGIEKAHLIGNSAGATASINIAVDHADRVLKIVAMGPGSRPSIFAPQPTEGIKVLSAGHMNPTMDALRALANVMLYDASQISDEALQVRVDTALRHLDAQRKNRESAQREGQVFTGRPQGPTRDYGAIQCPVLLVWGREDRVNPLDTGLSLLRDIRTANMFIFNNCGHWAQFEHADAFNRLVLDFLNS